MQDTRHADNSRDTVKRKHTGSAEHDGKLASPGGHHALKKPDPYGPCLVPVGGEIHASEYMTVPGDDTEDDGWCNEEDDEEAYEEDDEDDDEDYDEGDDEGDDEEGDEEGDEDCDDFDQDKDDCSGVGQDGNTKVDSAEVNEDKDKKQSGGRGAKVGEDDEKGKAAVGIGCEILSDDKLIFAKIVERGNTKDVVFKKEIRQKAIHFGLGVLSDARIELLVWLLYGLRPGRHNRLVDGTMQRNRGFKCLRLLGTDLRVLGADQVDPTAHTRQQDAHGSAGVTSSSTPLFATIVERGTHRHPMTTKQRENAMKQLSRKWLAQLKEMLRTVMDAELLQGNLFTLLKMINLVDVAHQLTNDTVRYNFEDECKILFLRRRVQLRSTQSNACVATANANKRGLQPLPEKETSVAVLAASPSQSCDANTNAWGLQPLPEKEISVALLAASPSQSCDAKTNVSGPMLLSGDGVTVGPAAKMHS